ncbi:MAG: choice-of-anchor Q domain-containing protein [Acidimicrobiales bacterium]
MIDGGRERSGRLFYNDVYNGTAAPFRWCPDTTGLVGNVSVDPRLAADFSLSAGSPAIDAGHDDPLLPLLGPTDANGRPRVVDGNGDGAAAVDLGAFEWPGPGRRAAAPIPAAYHPLPPAAAAGPRPGPGGRLPTGAMRRTPDQRPA